jgi:hypothetical protein
MQSMRFMQHRSCACTESLASMFSSNGAQVFSIGLSLRSCTSSNISIPLKVLINLFVYPVLYIFCYKNAKQSLRLTNQAPRQEDVPGSGCVGPRFLDIGTSWRWVVSFKPQPLYPLQKTLGTHCVGGWVGSRDAKSNPSVAIPTTVPRLSDFCYRYSLFLTNTNFTVSQRKG